MTSMILVLRSTGSNKTGKQVVYLMNLLGILYGIRMFALLQLQIIYQVTLMVEVDYSVHEVNKAEEDVWLVYPWENVGAY